MDDNTFECPNCGATVYPEMTRCPNCGRNMYPDDESSETGEEQVGRLRWIPALGATLIGWMVISGIALVFHFAVAGIVSPSTIGGVGKIVLFLAAPVGALVGGYVCAGLTKFHPPLLGGVAAAFSLPVLVLLATHWIQVTLSWLLNPLVIAIGLLTILGGVGGAWLHLRFSQDTGWKEKWRVRGWEDMLYQDLLRRVRFNGSAADRLIEYERSLKPQATRLELIQQAIERWERDNR